MPTVPPLIDPMPPGPEQLDPPTFRARQYATDVAKVAQIPQLNASAIASHANALEAASSAASALIYRDAANVAAVRAGAYSAAIAWVSGETYTSGTSVYSLIDYLTYRRLNTGAGTTDPKYDRANYECLHNLGALPTQAVSGNPVQAIPNINYLLVGFTVLLLPTAPPVNTFLEVYNLSGVLNCVVASATNSIMSLNEGVFIDKPNETVGFLFVGQPTGWVIQ